MTVALFVSSCFQASVLFVYDRLLNFVLSAMFARTSEPQQGKFVDYGRFYKNSTEQSNDKECISVAF